MNYRLTSAILKSVWAIEPLTALAYGAMISSLLNGEEFEVPNAEIIQPFAKARNGNISNTFDEAEEGSAAIIPLKGTLMKSDQWCGPVGMETIGNWIKDAYDSRNIDAVIIDSDTPGGTVDGVESLSEIIENRNKPVVSFFDGMLCSAGEWITAPSDLTIAATPLSQIGSIGVMFSFADIQPYYEEMGVKFHTIVADQSKDKNQIFYDMLKGNYDGIKKEMLNPMAIAFQEHMEKFRPKSTENQRTGKVFFAKDVIGSLVDSIGNLDFAIEQALSLNKPVSKTIKILHNV